jgi:hypothetical protein
MMEVINDKPRRRISLAPTPIDSNSITNQSETEKAFNDVLASISRAQKQRLVLKKEFEKYNTVQYCILEAGAETFELTKTVIGQSFEILWMIRNAIFDKIPVLQTLSFIRTTTTKLTQQKEDPRISELKAELDKLRSEMYSFSTLGNANHSSNSMSSRITSQVQELESENKKPLPFNAEMLLAAKKQQKTPIKAGEQPRSNPSSAAQPAARKEPSMQEVLQRVLQEKFKNVNSASNEDLDSSFDASEFKRKLEDESDENAIKRPPIPPRPKASARSGGPTMVKKRALMQQNQ